jgi:hypothetical protein
MILVGAGGRRRADIGWPLVEGGGFAGARPNSGSDRTRVNEATSCWMEVGGWVGRALEAGIR